MPSLEPCPCSERGCFCFFYNYIIILSGLKILEDIKFSQCFTVIFIHFCPFLKSRIICTNSHILPYLLTGSCTANPLCYISQVDKWKKLIWGERRLERMDCRWGIRLERKKIGIKPFPCCGKRYRYRMVNAYHFLLASNVCRRALLPQHPEEVWAAWSSFAEYHPGSQRVDLHWKAI